MEIVQIKISDLKEDINNVREHNKKNLDSIKDSIVKFGQYKPLIVQQSNMSVLVGNARLLAMKELNYQIVNCIIINVSDDIANLLKIADNRTADLSNWDYDKLLSQIEILPKEFIETSFDDSDIEYFKKLSKQKILLKSKSICCPFCNYEFTLEKE